jgi:RNA polymerase sigma factor (sigma-70 family)
MLLPAQNDFLLREEEVWESKEYPHPMIHLQSGPSAQEFAAECRGWLLGLARNLCRGSKTDAEDLVQETLLRFVQKGQVNALPAREHWHAWLAKTLKNLFMDQCRRQDVQQRGAADPSLSEEKQMLPGTPPLSPYDSITDEQFTQALQEALSPTLRETFLLHMSGKKMAEIGRILGTQEGTVRKRLYDSRLKLREFLCRYVPCGAQ